MRNDFVLSHWTICMVVANDNYCCIQRIHNYKAKWCIQYYPSKQDTCYAPV